MVKLTDTQRWALTFLTTRTEATLATMEDHANVSRGTLDGLCKRGLVEFGGGEYVSVAATVEHFKHMQRVGLYASITVAGRAALAEGGAK